MAGFNKYVIVVFVIFNSRHMHVFFRLVGLGIIIALVGILIVFTFQYNLRNLSKFFFWNSENGQWRHSCASDFSELLVIYGYY